MKGLYSLHVGGSSQLSTNALRMGYSFIEDAKYLEDQ